METIRTDFSPSDHGFRFVNRFALPDSVTRQAVFGRRNPLRLDHLVYGLCGGMCFAARDFFGAHRPVPDTASVDEIGAELFNYLVTRQVKSLRGGVVPKLVKWMMRDDPALARSMVGWEIPKLREKLSAGEPSVLVLVRAHRLADIALNHQVLATGYDLDPVTRDLSVYLYDPNHPNMAPALLMNLAKPKEGIKLRQSTGEALRGFFVIDYRTQPLP
ncbi:MAG: hypothetical protein GXY76_02705 [Chloroflexi bacterium]|nr:hypothetical protein [Chloroflexota bacterium]